MFKFQVNEQSLDKLVLRLFNNIDKNLEQARSEIRTEWGREIYRQQLEFHRSSVWPALNPAYQARKTRELGWPGTTLRKTGEMLRGYVNGIRTNASFPDGSDGVSMPFPAGEAEIRAKAHQGVIGQPVGMPKRPFDVDRFHTIAVDKYKEAIKKSLDED